MIWSHNLANFIGSHLHGLIRVGARGDNREWEADRGGREWKGERDVLLVYKSKTNPKQLWETKQPASTANTHTVSFSHTRHTLWHLHTLFSHTHTHTRTFLLPTPSGSRFSSYLWHVLTLHAAAAARSSLQAALLVLPLPLLPAPCSLPVLSSLLANCSSEGHQVRCFFAVSGVAFWAKVNASCWQQQAQRTELNCTALDGKPAQRVQVIHAIAVAIDQSNDNAKQLWAASKLQFELENGLEPS